MYAVRFRSEVIRAAAAAVTIAILLTGVLAGCTEKSYRTECLPTMGTAISLTAYADEGSFDELMSGVREILAYAEALEGKDGLYERFCSAGNGEKIELDETVYGILKTIIDDPLFDGYNPLLGNSVDLWGFSVRVANGGEAMPYDRPRNAEGGFAPPDERYVEAFLSLADLDGLELVEENGKFYCIKNIPEVEIDGRRYSARLDLGGSIKGYCTDKIRELYIKSGIEYGYISFGTSSVCLLKNRRGEWTLSLTHPDDPSQSYYSVRLPEGNASTSGDYENRYFADGESYCHIIGRDGRPVKNARCVTVIGPSAMLCDMLSTALMTLPKEELTARIALLKERGYDAVYYFGENDIGGTL